MFSRFFIDRPIFAAVLSIFIVIAGLAAMRVLPIAQYPEIAPPVVTCARSIRALRQLHSSRPLPRRSKMRSTELKTCCT